MHDLSGVAFISLQQHRLCVGTTPRTGAIAENTFGAVARKVDFVITR